MLEVLVAAGFGAEEALRSLLALASYVTGSALEREGARGRDAGGGGGSAEPTAAPGAADRQEGTPDISQYPNLQAAVGAARDPDEVFEAGLRAIVAGLRAELEQRQR